MPTPAELDEIILAAAKSDAQYDGRPWNSLSRAERERYQSRATMSVDATLKRVVAIVEKEAGDDLVKRMSLDGFSCTPEHAVEAAYLLSTAEAAIDRLPGNSHQIGETLLDYVGGELSVEDAVSAFTEDLRSSTAEEAAPSPAKKAKAKAA